MKPYAPKPGSYPARAIEALSEGPLFGRALADELGVPFDHLYGYLNSLVKHKLVATRVVGSGRYSQSVWSLAGAADDLPEDAPLSPRAAPGPTAPTWVLDRWMCAAVAGRGATA